ncbi:MAG: hypothetical protein H3C38_03995 [Rhodospirillales bacterium]|nr:hypothetical protein [Rhodospirillales bacterium]
MVEYVGFHDHEERLIRELILRLDEDAYVLGELRRVEKAHLPGYNGRVCPKLAADSDRWEMTMSLSSCDPFTIAHELAHVSDIAVRRNETRSHLSQAMPHHWHVAHNMSSEYYANRVACEYSDEAHVVGAFRSDVAGLALAAREQDWAAFATYYSLILGILHAHNRHDGEPLKVLSGVETLPSSVIEAMTSFKTHASNFFENYRVPLPSAA